MKEASGRWKTSEAPRSDLGDESEGRAERESDSRASGEEKVASEVLNSWRPAGTLTPNCGRCSGRWGGGHVCTELELCGEEGVTCTPQGNNQNTVRNDGKAKTQT